MAGGSTSPNPLPWVQRLDMGWYLLPFRGAGVNSTHTPPNTHSGDGILRGEEKKTEHFTYSLSEGRRATFFSDLLSAALNIFHQESLQRSFRNA